MSEEMLKKVIFFIKGSRADVTLVWQFPRMCKVVLREVALSRKGLVAHVTLVGFFSRMGEEMS